MRRDEIRNIAIIAHVDHGKTTLVDALMKQSGLFRDTELAQECLLDSNDLERERGITILAKNIAIAYKGVKINIIDTPGHADFGGEVERVLRMADGALMLVDAAEGPKPQTRFVLTKALQVGLQPLIVVNKVDRPDSRADDVIFETMHLMEELGAKDVTNIPHIFASGRSGYASEDSSARSGDMAPLLDMVLKHIPGPEVDVDVPFRMTVTSLMWSKYVGRIAVGRIYCGKVSPGQKVAVIKENGTETETIDTVELFAKLGREKVDVAVAGDIVAITGLPDVEIGDTIASLENPVALPRIKVDEPTLSMTFTINTSPLVGKSGKYTKKAGTLANQRGKALSNFRLVGDRGIARDTGVGSVKAMADRLQKKKPQMTPDQVAKKRKDQAAMRDFRNRARSGDFGQNNQEGMRPRYNYLKRTGKLKTYK
jgi:GTP-binding protein